MKAERFVLYAVIALSLTSCLSDDGRNDKLNEEVKLIDDYLTANGITENVLYDNFNGIRVHVHEYGKLAPPHDGQDVTINYVGKLFSNGSIFATGVITDKVQNLSPFGLELTVRSMMTGSNVTAYIPSPSGFGSAGANGVPPDAILVYDIFLAHTARTATEKAQFKADSTAIVKYISDNSLDLQLRTGDVWMTVDQPGVGPFPNPYSIVSLDYKLSLLSNPGTVFDEGALNERPIFELIDGFKIVLPMLNEGAKARFILPSILGYGPTGTNTGIPANSILIYEITLKDIHE
jgi:FKBP-type peptidyl-prolyl cis-trans isomerase